MVEEPLLSIIIVTWNNEKDILLCLKSISEQDYKNYNIIVVDNASSDSTVKLVKEKYPNVELITLENNIYLTGGNNLGIEYALSKYNPEYVMVLNPDTYLADNVLSELVNYSKTDKRIGALGPMVKFWRNKNEGLINSAGLYYDGFMQAYDVGFMQKDEGQFSNPRQVFGVTGACILYRAEMLLQIGLYDNRIKMYMDEVELFIRAHKADWKVYFVPSAVIGHNYMQSTNKNKDFNRNKQMQKAWLIIALKHYKLKSKLAMIKKFLGL